MIKRILIVFVVAFELFCVSPAFSAGTDVEQNPTVIKCMDSDGKYYPASAEHPCRVALDTSFETTFHVTIDDSSSDSILDTISDTLADILTDMGTALTSLSSIVTNTGTIAGKDFSTQTTLATMATGLWCTNGAALHGMAWNANGSETDASPTITNICAGGTCKRVIVRNWDTTNSVQISFNSTTNYGICLGPAAAAGQPSSIDSSLWSPGGVTAIYRRTTGTTSGCPTAATVGAAHMDIIGCQ